MDRQFLQRLHEQLGISQAELGRLLKISQPQVSRALGGVGPLNSDASSRAFRLAEERAPDIAREARLLDQATKALRNSEKFRDLVRAALALIQEDA